MSLALYLANKPQGAPLVYLIMAATIFGLATIFAGWTRDIWRALVSAGLVLLVLALVTH